MPSLSPTLASARSDRSVAAQARFWDRIARKYAASPIADQDGYENTLWRVQALLSPQDSVLEVGCGTGTTALRLAGGVRRLLATDVSPQMIAIAREKLAAQPQPSPPLRFGVAAADAPPPPPTGGFDAVLAFNLLHLVPDLDTTLAALVPILKPGGLFISKTACLAEMNPLITRVAVPLMRAIGKAPAVLLSFDAPRLCAALERHGLAIDAVERHGTKRGKDFRVFVVARKRP